MSRNTNKMTDEVVSLALGIIEKVRHCMVGTNGEDGYPYIKVMTNRKHDGIKKNWFSTDTSSRRIQQVKRDSKSSVYCLDVEHSRGLILLGKIEILHDLESKKMLWREGDEKYRPLGVEDPENSVLCFTAIQGNFVDAMKNLNITFDIESWKG